MARETYVLDEALKNSIVAAVKKFKETRHQTLQPVFDEVIEHLNSEGEISSDDAYRARYIRDSLVLGEANAEEFKDVLDYLEKTFFS